LIKLGKILFKHPEGTHDDRFRSTALVVYATCKTFTRNRSTLKVSIIFQRIGTEHWLTFKKV